MGKIAFPSLTNKKPELFMHGTKANACIAQNNAPKINSVWTATKTA